MPFVTKYGTYFGLVPAQLGRVHFVAPAASYTVDGRSYSASDNNDGLSPERALLTISQALTNITASAGEVIFLLEGTHSPSATVRIQKAGITIAGVRSSFASDLVAGQAFGAGRLKSVVDFGTAAAPGFSVEADNVEICWVELRPASGFSGVIFRNANPDGFYFHDSVVNLGAGQALSLDTQGVDFAYRADTAGLAGRSMSRLAQTTQKATAYLANVAFVSGGAQGHGLLTATADVTVVGCRFHNRINAWATPFMVATGTGFVLVQGSMFTAPQNGGIGTGISGQFAGTIAGKFYASDCRFAGVTITGAGQVSGARAISDFAVGTGGSSECYVAGMATAYTISSL